MTAEPSRGDGLRPWFRDPDVLLVLGLALAVRLLYLIDLRHTPFFAFPQMDAAYHDAWARGIAAGDWGGSEVFFRAPLYPYFLGLLYAVFGPQPLMVRIVQFLIGAATAGLTTRLSRPVLGRAGALAAGLLVAVHGPLLYFEGELLLVVLEAPLALLLAWASWRVLARGGTRAAVGAGAMLGLGALARPNVLAYLPVLGGGILWRYRARAWRPVTAVFLTTGLVLLPALIRNYAVGGDVVPVASQGGYNFYLGNNPNADGRAAVAPEFRRSWQEGLDDARRLAEEAEGRSLSPSEVSGYWFRRGLDWITSRPRDFLVLTGRKLGYFWDAFEIPNNQDVGFFFGLTRIGSAGVLSSFTILGPLALLGLVLGTRRLGFAWVSLPLVHMAVIVLFFVCGRFRAPLVPLFAVWAGAAVAEVLVAVRKRQRGRLLTGTLVLVLASLLVNGDWWGMRRLHSPAESHLRVGEHYRRQGDLDRAASNFRSALQARPAFPEAWNNLGVTLAQAGDLPGAEEAFARALDAAPGHPQALGNAAALAFQRGRETVADSLARRVLEVGTGEPGALYNAAVVLGNLGHADAALRGFRGVLVIDPDRVDAKLGAARALWLLGEREEARTLLETIEESQRTEEIRQLLREEIRR